MKSKTLNLTICLLIIFLGSCRSKTRNLNDNTIKFETIHSSKTYHINNDTALPNCKLTLTFTYPVLLNDNSKLDSLQHIFITNFFDESYVSLNPQEAVKAYENNYVESYKDDVRTYSQDKYLEHDSLKEVFPSYVENDSTKIIFNKGDLLSYQILLTTYKGSLSSYDFMKNYVIDLNSLKVINESDLFTDGADKMLATLLKQNLMQDKNVKDLQDLEDLGYFGLDEMLPNSNFLLDEKGITYIFNKGEYSNYKTDALEIFIPYNEIKSLIRDNSPISKFISK